MSYKLVIVESPAKCQKIEKFLGAGYKCIASFGHIRELNGLKSIDINNNFKPTFINTESKQSQINKLKSMIRGADEVLLAADDDREGEAIAWHICDLFKLPIQTTKRMIFHEITEPAVKNALQNVTTLNMNIVNAQLSRQILDILVGYKVSPILWNQISQNKNKLSAGRCQTPALRIVYDNHKEIETSPGKKVYKTTGYFTKSNLPFVLNYDYDNEDIINEFLEESVNHEHIYNCGKEKNTTKQPPTPFTTSSLQQMANNELRLSPKDTMKSCQILYEGGFITYMRTDSKTYSEEFVNNAKKYINDTYGEEYPNKNIYDLCRKDAVEEKSKSKSKSKKEKEKKDNNAQEAHEAIRPTSVSVLEPEITQTITPKEVKLYKLIRRNTLESCIEAAKYLSITATITSPQEHIYKYSTEQVVFPGWKIVNGYEVENKDFRYLQTLKNNSELDYNKITCKVTIKDLKSHYTEAKLVQLLEQKGIGRPSTFSSLIEKIQERGYII